ncbi:TonB-dependent receptor plug domain-containing protein [Maribacter sp. 2307ULW6-5]|uniref:TonB-dependent receptor n=1 Tax=Maribacter sp. 2307ULW6-5 TaxID=3386275 RepID=UPI0039BD030B
MLQAPPRPKTYIQFLIGAMLLLAQGLGAQGEARPKVAATTYLNLLEERFNVKFSYADEALGNIQVPQSEANVLEVILKEISASSILRFQPLNDRYYSVTTRESLSLCLRVLDNFEQNTIPGASVQVLGTKIQGVTDATGKLLLEEVPGRAMLQINHLGFKPLFVPASSLLAEPCPALAMAMAYQELEEVVLHHFLTTGLSKLTDASIVLETDAFDLLPGLVEPDVLQTVQALPGIKSVDETVSDINIRGGTNDQNLLLWDGIKMYQSGHFFGLISAFNPYLTDRVTLINNGSSARFSDGVSGTLDMRTSNELGNTLRGGAGFNLISGDAFAQVPLGKDVALQFSARRSHTDVLQTPTYTSFSERAFQDSDVAADSDFHFYDFTAKLLYDISPKHQLRGSLVRMSNNLDYQEGNSGPASANQSLLDQNNLSFGGSWDSEWSDVFRSRASTYYTRYGLDALTRTNGRQTLLQKNDVLETSARLDTEYRPAPNFSWHNGYQFTETGITNTTNLDQPFFESTVRGVVRIHALYSEAEHRSKDQKFFARLGARMNHYENLDSFRKTLVEPRANLSYEVLPHLRMEALGEFKSQATNQIIDLEQNFLGIERRRWILSDGENLPITQSQQGSLGINYDKNTLYLGLTAFYKEVQGINIRTQGFQNQDQFNNETGAYDIWGLEFLANVKNTNYSAWFSYTYNDNQYRFNTLTPMVFPNNLEIRHSLTLAGNYHYNDFSLGLGINYRSGRPYTLVDANAPVNRDVVPNTLNYATPNGSRLPEYLRVDASARYSFNINGKLRATVGASVLNLTHRTNILNIYHRLNDSNELETIERRALGLTPNATFRLKF